MAGVRMRKSKRTGQRHNYYIVHKLNKNKKFRKSQKLCWTRQCFISVGTTVYVIVVGLEILVTKVFALLDLLYIKNRVKSRVIFPCFALYRKFNEVYIILLPVLHFQNTLARLLPVKMEVYARRMMTEQTIHAHVPMKAAFMHSPAKTVKHVSFFSVLFIGLCVFCINLT